MHLARISWRNLRRNMVRTSIAVLAVTTVVVIVIFARALMVGSVDSSFRMYIDNSFGHVRITEREYQRREPLLPLRYTIDGFDGSGAEEMIGQIEHIDSVEHVLPRIRFAVTAEAGNGFLRMIGVGVDPARETAYGALPGDIQEGRMPQTGDEILLGLGLSEELEAGLGSTVTVTFADTGQAQHHRTLEVVGIAEAGVAGLDNRFFYLPLQTAWDMLQLQDQVTELLVFASDARRASALYADLTDLLERRNGGQYTAVIWNQADPFVEFFYEMTKIMDLVYVMFILMGSVVIITTLTMIVRERTREIGVMAALGLKGRDIMKVFLLEGAYMGLVGSLLGAVAGGLITRHYSQAGLHAEDFARLSADMDLLIEPVFYLAHNAENLIISFALGLIVVVLACLYPAFRAARLEPVDALHHIDE